MAKKEENRELSPAIKDHYELVGILPGKVIIDNQAIDFRTISKEKADALFNQKVKYLKKKGGDTPAKTK